MQRPQADPVSSPSSAEAEQRAASAMRRLVPRAAISLLIAGGFVWAFKRGGVPLAPPPGTLVHLKWWAIPAFAASNAVAMALRTHRLIYLVRPLRPDASRPGVVGVGLVGYGAIFYAPLRLGEVVRPYLLSQHERMKFGQGLGVIAAERIIDGLAVVIMTAAGLALSVHVSPLPDHIGNLPIPVSIVPKALRSATLMFGVAFVGMAGLYATRSFAIDLLRRIVGRVSARLANSLAQTLERVLEGFTFLPSVNSTGPFVLQTALCWLATIFSQWTLMRGVGLEATLAMASVTTGVVSLGSLLPAGPGFFGAYQIAMYTSLAMFFAPTIVTTQGALFVFSGYACHVVMNLIFPLIGFYLLARSSRGGRVATAANHG